MKLFKRKIPEEHKFIAYCLLVVFTIISFFVKDMSIAKQHNEIMSSLEEYTVDEYNMKASEYNSSLKGVRGSIISGMRELKPFPIIFR